MAAGVLSTLLTFVLRADPARQSALNTSDIISRLPIEETRVEIAFHGRITEWHSLSLAAASNLVSACTGALEWQPIIQPSMHVTYSTPYAIIRIRDTNTNAVDYIQVFGCAEAIKVNGKFWIVKKNEAVHQIRIVLGEALSRISSAP